MFKPLLSAAALSALSLACATTSAQTATDTASQRRVQSSPIAAKVQQTSALTDASGTSERTPTPRRAMMQRVLSSNVRLFVWDEGTAKRSASAVVVGSEATSSGTATYLVTNAHALDVRGMKAPELRVVVDRPWEAASAEPMEFLAQPVAVGRVPEMDLALIKVIGIQLDAAELAADEELVPGDNVVVAAAPFGRAVSLSGGLVSHVEWDRKTGAPQVVKTDAPIGYGASGGGIYSVETGRLLAIVEGYRTAKINLAVAKENVSFDVPMPGETFAAPAAKVRAFITQKGFGRILQPAEPAPAPTRAAIR